MDHSNAPPATTPAKAQRVLVLQGGGALGSYQAGAFQALCRAGFEPEWIAGISIGAINAAIIAGNEPEKRVGRLKEFWEMVSSPVPWNPGHTRRPRALAVQRNQRRADRDLRRARLLHPAHSAGAAMAAGQPAIAELLRHRAAEEDAGTAGRLRPHQRPEDAAQRRRGRRDLGQSSDISTISNSGSSARRSARSTSWPPARCRPAFPPSRSKASITGTAASPPTRRSIIVLGEETNRDLLIFQVDLFSARGRIADVAAGSRRARKGHPLFQPHPHEHRQEQAGAQRAQGAARSASENCPIISRAIRRWNSSARRRRKTPSRSCT